MQADVVAVLLRLLLPAIADALHPHAVVRLRRVSKLFARMVDAEALASTAFAERNLTSDALDVQSPSNGPPTNFPLGRVRWADLGPVYSASLLRLRKFDHASFACIYTQSWSVRRHRTVDREHPAARFLSGSLRLSVDQIRRRGRDPSIVNAITFMLPMTWAGAMNDIELLLALWALLIEWRASPDEAGDSEPLNYLLKETLCLAAFNGSIDTVNLLLSSRFPHITSDHPPIKRAMAFGLAASNGQIDVARAFLDSQPPMRIVHSDPVSEDEDEDAATDCVILAATSHSVPMAQMLVAAGFDPTCNGNRALVEAAMKRDEEMVRYLLTLPAVSVVSDALVPAARSGNLAILSALLDAHSRKTTTASSVDPSLRVGTPLMLAVAGKNIGVFELLLASGFVLPEDRARALEYLAPASPEQEMYPTEKRMVEMLRDVTK